MYKVLKGTDFEIEEGPHYVAFCMTVCMVHIHFDRRVQDVERGRFPVINAINM